MQATSMLMSGLLALAAGSTQPPAAATAPPSSLIKHCTDGTRHAHVELTLFRQSGDLPFLVRIEHYRLHGHASATLRRPSLLLSTRPVTPFGLWNSRPSNTLFSDSEWHSLGLELEETRHSTLYDVVISIDFDLATEDRTSKGSCTITLVGV